jgi:hypothetical protein
MEQAQQKPFFPGLQSPAQLRHPRPDGRPHRDTGWIKALEAEDVHAVVVRSDALPMESIDSASLAEIVPCRSGMKLILGQRSLAGNEAKRRLVDFHHQRVLASADRAVASREFREVGFDFEADRPTVARTRVRLNLPARGVTDLFLALRRPNSQLGN